MEGYPIDKDIMREHAQFISDFYAGDGWYRDGHAFDYYSCWAFNLYTPIWNLWYGYEQVHDAHQNLIDYAAAAAADDADEGADGDRENDGDGGNRDRETAADQQPAEHVAPQMVRSQPVGGAWRIQSQAQVLLCGIVGRNPRGDDQ